MSAQKPQVARVQGVAPSFTAEAVVNGEFKNVSLSDYKGKYIVLFSYPFDFTFVCPTEIIAFSDRAEDFKKINCQLLAFSCDSKFVHLSWINTKRSEGGIGKINYPLIADPKQEISKAYDVYVESEGCPLRGLFIIDDKGIIRQITKNDLPVGRSVDETLRLVKAFQFTDKHGEVCPVNWNPNDNADTMNPDPSKSKEYFSKKYND